MSKYTPELVDEICEILSSQPLGRVLACKKVGIHYQTFCDWMKNKPDFSERVKRAEKQGRDWKEEYAVNCIFNQMKKQWTAGAWWLERTNPEKYGEKVKVEDNRGKILEALEELAGEPDEAENKESE